MSTHIESGRTSYEDDAEKSLLDEHSRRSSTSTPPRKSHVRWLVVLCLALAIALLVSLSFYKTDTPTNGFDMNLVATIIETRDLPILIPLLSLFMSIVPPEWPFVVWCSQDNHESLVTSTALRAHIESGKLNITLLPEELTLETSEDLSRFLTRRWFWDQFTAEYALFFQADSVLCSASDHSVNDWLGYDWVGTPPGWGPSDGHGGNGGLSIRSIPTMKRVLSEMVRPDYNGEPDVPHKMAEDYWFMTAIDAVLGSEARWPEKDNRTQFDFGYAFGHAGANSVHPIGYHEGSGNALALISPDDAKWQEAIHYCPEIVLVLDSNAGRFD